MSAAANCVRYKDLPSDLRRQDCWATFHPHLVDLAPRCSTGQRPRRPQRCDPSPSRAPSCHVRATRLLPVSCTPSHAASQCSLRVPPLVPPRVLPRSTPCIPPRNLLAILPLTPPRRTLPHTALRILPCPTRCIPHSVCTRAFLPCILPYISPCIPPRFPPRLPSHIPGPVRAWIACRLVSLDCILLVSPASYPALYHIMYPTSHPALYPCLVSCQVSCLVSRLASRLVSHLACRLASLPCFQPSISLRFLPRIRLHTSFLPFLLSQVGACSPVATSPCGLARSTERNRCRCACGQCSPQFPVLPGVVPAEASELCAHVLGTDALYF